MKLIFAWQVDKTYKSQATGDVTSLLVCARYIFGSRHSALGTKTTREPEVTQTNDSANFNLGSRD
jgi:hypothetical protein